MLDLAGKVAVVTGGASGIGKALGARLAREGMKVVLSDVEKGALDAAVADLCRDGGAVTGVVADVSKLESVEALAEHAFDAHGAVHVLCNNAGVGTDETRTKIWESAANDWRWVLAVNVWGVLHGIQAFVPRMLESGQEGRVVNTSSGNGGLYPLPTTPIYSTSKAAVTTISEVLNYQFQMVGAKISASVLYPGPHIVDTGIFAASRNRPEELPYESDPGTPPSLDDIRAMAKAAGMDLQVTQPDEVAEYAVEGIKAGRFWILPESEDSDAKLRDRLEGILARRNPPLAF